MMGQARDEEEDIQIKLKPLLHSLVNPLMDGECKTCRLFFFVDSASHKAAVRRRTQNEEETNRQDVEVVLADAQATETIPAPPGGDDENSRHQRVPAELP